MFKIIICLSILYNFIYKSLVTSEFVNISGTQFINVFHCNYIFFATIYYHSISFEKLFSNHLLIIFIANLISLQQEIIPHCMILCCTFMLFTIYISTYFIIFFIVFNNYRSNNRIFLKKINIHIVLHKIEILIPDDIDICNFVIINIVIVFVFLMCFLFVDNIYFFIVIFFLLFCI